MSIGKRLLSFMLSVTIAVSSCFGTSRLLDLPAFAAESKTVTCTAHTTTQTSQTFHSITQSYTCQHSITYSVSAGCSKCGEVTLSNHGITCSLSGSTISPPNSTYCMYCGEQKTTTVSHTLTNVCMTCRKTGVSGQNYYTCNTHHYRTTSSSSCGQGYGCSMTGPTYGHVQSTSSNITDYYYSAAYGYKGNSSKITVYPLSVTTNDGITSSTTVTGSYGTATTIDYVYPSNNVTLTLGNLPANCGAKITVNGTETTLAAGTTSYSFTMPAAETTVSVELALLSPTNTYPSSIQKTYGDAPVSLGFTTNSDGLVTYTSSESSVVSVDQNGVLTFVKPGSATITVTTSETSNYFASTSTVNVIVNKADPNIITPPTAAAITYGQSLVNAVLNGTTDVAGSFKWVDETIKPAVSDSDTTSYDIVFEPDEPDYYNSITGLSSTVTVHKADAVDGLIGAPTASDIVYGQTLAGSIISQAIDATVTGRFEWQDPTIAPKASDSNNTQYNVTFIPDDTANYNVRNDILLTLTVSKAMPVISGILTASDITYGNTLADSVIDVSGMTTDVTGRFEWETPDHKPAATTGTDYNIVFIPDDENYATVSGLTANVVVNKAVYRPSEEELAALSSTPITYGDTLEQSALSNSVTPTVAGHYEWVDKTIVPSVRDSLLTEYDVVFIPDDIDNYNITTGLKATVQVNKADYIPTTDELASVDVSDLVYEQTLNDSVISGTFVTDGSFGWEDPTIKPTVADSDTTSYNVIFTDNDGNYNPYVIPVTVHVDKKQFSAADFEGLHATGIYYGQTLAKSVITCTNNVCDGAFAWQDDSIMPNVADSNTTPYLFDFIPTDTDNYGSVTGIPLTVTVSPANPSVSTDVINGLSASTITYGQSLSGSIITSAVLPVSPNDVSISIPGHWEWVNGDTIYPTVADSNRTEYDVIYVPDDTVNYAVITGIKMTVGVNKANYVLSDAELASIKASAITKGQTLEKSDITGTIGIDGTFSWDDPTIKPAVSDSGVTPYGISFIVSDPNYNNITGLSTTVVVKKPSVPSSGAGPSLFTVPTFDIITTPIYVGQTLANSILSADEAIDGILTWADPSIKPSFVDSNVTMYDVLYTPNDATHVSYRLKATVTVNKNQLEWDTTGYEKAEDGVIVIRKTYGDPDFNLGINAIGVKDAVFVYTEDNNNDTISVDNVGTVCILNAGSEDITVTFVGDDYWADAVLTVRVIVSKQVPVIPDDIVLSISTTPIIYGESLGNSTIVVDGIEIDGYFEWEDTDIVPELSDSDTTEYTLVFHPYDVRNYDVIKLYKATVTVVEADNSIPIEPPTEPVTPENTPADIPVKPSIKPEDDGDKEAEDVIDNPHTGVDEPKSIATFAFVSFGALFASMFMKKRKDTENGGC